MTEEKKIMGNFEWVHARSACSLVTVFEKLKLQVEADVETRNSLRRPEPAYGGQQPGFAYKFEVVGSAGNFKVILNSNTQAEAVTFKRGDKFIWVTDTNGDKMFEAFLTLSDDGECRVKINGQERELWHMRRMALEHLFFGIY